MPWYLEPAREASEPARKAALARQASLTKPSGALGRLESLAVDVAALQNSDRPALSRSAVRIFAGDHGVADEGVSAFPQAVTQQMIHNFATGGAAISVLARQLGADFAVINMGTAEPANFAPQVVNLQLMPGTQRFCDTPAMTAEQCEGAMRVGYEHFPAGCDVFLGGEMGIGNTTSAAALTSALLQLSPGETVGLGTGVDEQGLLRKRSVVAKGLALHAGMLSDPVGALRCLGGLEIAALTGAFIHAAQTGVIALVDGYICSVAALLACRINPGVRPWLFFAHRSAEPGHRHVLEALEAEPLLDFGLRLGEGSGAALALPLLQSACALHNEMSTFAQAGVSEGRKP